MATQELRAYIEAQRADNVAVGELGATESLTLTATDTVQGTSPSGTPFTATTTVAVTVSVQPQESDNKVIKEGGKAAAGSQ